MNRYMQHTIVDRIRFFSEHSRLRKPLVKIVSALQNYKPEERVMAPALTFSCMCDALGLDPFEVLVKVRRMTKAVDGPFTKQYAAMTDYVKGEILKGE